MTIHAGGFRRQSTEALIAAAIRYFREQPERIQQALIDMEVVVQAHPGPNPCAEIVLDRPVEPCTIGRPGDTLAEALKDVDRAAQIQESKYGDREMPKEPGQRAAEAFYGGSFNSWERFQPDTKAAWARAEKACQPELRPVVAKDHYLSLEELIHRMKLMQDRWLFVTSDGRTSRTNLPEQALACLIGMKAELDANESLPEPSDFPEVDCFKLEAAEQYGFRSCNDGKTYRATCAQIIDLVNAAQKQGLVDAIKILTEKTNG